MNNCMANHRYLYGKPIDSAHIELKQSRLDCGVSDVICLRGEFYEKMKGNSTLLIAMQRSAFVSFANLLKYFSISALQLQDLVIVKKCCCWKLLLQRGHIACNTERCNIYSNSVCLSHAGTLSRRMKGG